MWPTFLWDKHLGHTVSLSQAIMFLHQNSHQGVSEITGPWDEGHSELFLFCGQSSEHADSLSHSHYVQT